MPAGGSEAETMRGPGGRAGFQPAGSRGILPQVSGRTRRSNTNARLEAARTGRRGRLPYDAVKGSPALPARSSRGEGEDEAAAPPLPLSPILRTRQVGTK